MLILKVLKKLDEILKNAEEFFPGSKIPLILQDLRRILTRTSRKSLQETYKIASKTAYKISWEDVLPGFFQDLTRSYKILTICLAKILPRCFQDLLRSYKINKLLSPGLFSGKLTFMVHNYLYENVVFSFLLLEILVFYPVHNFDLMCQEFFRFGCFSMTIQFFCQRSIQTKA